MLSVLGAEAGHMGIRLLASGGVYLTGAFHSQLLVLLVLPICDRSLVYCSTSHTVLQHEESKLG